MVLAVALGAPGLREAHVHADAAAAADPVEDAVDHPAAALVLVEAQRLVVVEIARRLRDREGQRVLDVARERVGITKVVGPGVAQEGNEVARRREAQARHERVLGDVGELVDRALQERAARQLDGGAGVRGVVPAARGDVGRRLAQVRLHGEPRLRLVEGGRRIGERARRCRGVVEDDVLVRRARNRRAVAVRRHRHGDGEVVVAGWRRDVPAVPRQAVALVHQERVARIRRGGRVVAAARAVEGAEELVAAVVDLDEQLVVAVAQIDRLQDVDVHRVLDVAARVARRELDVGDDPVASVVRVDFAVGLAAQLLVGAGGPERARHARDRILEGRRLDAGDLDLGDARLRARYRQAERRRKGERHGRAPPVDCNFHYSSPGK